MVKLGSSHSVRRNAGSCFSQILTFVGGNKINYHKNTWNNIYSVIDSVIISLQSFAFSFSARSKTEEEIAANFVLVLSAALITDRVHEMHVNLSLLPFQDWKH